MTQHQTGGIVVRSFLWVLLAVFMISQAVLMSIHKRIIPADVARVEVHAGGAQVAQPLTPQETRQVIGWFNRAGSFRRNANHDTPGCGAYSTLTFYLQSGEVVNVESDMRVTRGTPEAGQASLPVDYYFKQPNLERYLRDWDARAGTQGC